MQYRPSINKCGGAADASCFAGTVGVSCRCGKEDALYTYRWLCIASCPIEQAAAYPLSQTVGKDVVRRHVQQYDAVVDES